MAAAKGPALGTTNSVVAVYQQGKVRKVFNPNKQYLKVVYIKIKTKMEEDMLRNIDRDINGLLVSHEPKL